MSLAKEFEAPVSIGTDLSKSLFTWARLARMVFYQAPPPSHPALGPTYHQRLRSLALVPVGSGWRAWCCKGRMGGSCERGGLGTESCRRRRHDKSGLQSIEGEPLPETTEDADLGLFSISEELEKPCVCAGRIVATQGS